MTCNTEHNYPCYRSIKVLFCHCGASQPHSLFILIIWKSAACVLFKYLPLVFYRRKKKRTTQGWVNRLLIFGRTIPLTYQTAIFHFTDADQKSTVEESKRLCLGRFLRPSLSLCVHVCVCVWQRGCSEGEHIFIFNRYTQVKGQRRMTAWINILSCPGTVVSSEQMV